MFISQTTFEKFANMMEKGQKYIIPQRGTEWCIFCFNCMENPYSRSALQDYIYKIIKMLSITKTVDGIAELVDDGALPDESWEGVILSVVKYSPLGYEFSKTSKRPLSSQTLETIEKLKKENDIIMSTPSSNTSRR